LSTTNDTLDSATTRQMALRRGRSRSPFRADNETSASLAAAAAAAAAASDVSNLYTTLCRRNDTDMTRYNFGVNRSILTVCVRSVARRVDVKRLFIFARCSTNASTVSDVSKTIFGRPRPRPQAARRRRTPQFQVSEFTRLVRLYQYGNPTGMM